MFPRPISDEKNRAALVGIIEKEMESGFQIHLGSIAADLAKGIEIPWLTPCIIQSDPTADPLDIIIDLPISLGAEESVLSWQFSVAELLKSWISDPDMEVGADKGAAMSGALRSLADEIDKIVHDATLAKAAS